LNLKIVDQELEKPKIDEVVESHRCGQNAQRWGHGGRTTARTPFIFSKIHSAVQAGRIFAGAVAMARSAPESLAVGWFIQYHEGIGQHLKRLIRGAAISIKLFI
jgi:hypothetical protein